LKPRGFKIEHRSSEIEQQYQRLLTKNNKYINNQSVNRDEPTDQKEIEKVKSKIIAMGYPCLEEEMIIKSLVDITRTKGIKFIDKLSDKKIIDFALNKFKKLDKTKINNYQAYFTSVLNNSVFEYAASEIAGQEQSTNVPKNPTNKFHNFTQRTYAEGELEEIARKKFKKKVQELKASGKIITDKEDTREV